MKKTLTLSIEKAREIYYKGDDTMNSLLLETFSKEELEHKEVKSWWDLGVIKGYCIGADSSVYHCTPTKPEEYCRNIWVTEEQAEASIAMAQLSQLMKHYNGDWIPDWENIGCTKYIIYIHKGRIHASLENVNSKFLSFPTKKIRDRFLENHRNLILMAKPLL